MRTLFSLKKSSQHNQLIYNLTSFRLNDFLLVCAAGMPNDQPRKSFFEKLSEMALDEATVRKIAKLARIKVPENEVPTLAEELSKIIEWIEQLNEVDTENVTKMTSMAEMVMNKRADKVTDGNYPDRVLSNAPNPEGPFYTVPKVIE